MRHKILVFSISLLMLINISTLMVTVSVSDRSMRIEEGVLDHIQKNEMEGISPENENVTQENIKEVQDWHDLEGMRDDLSGDYVLTNDLDESVDGYDELVDTEKGWEPIGEYHEDNDLEFTGTFDGNGYKINSLYINRPETNEVGLFGYIENAEIANVSVVEADVSGNELVGGLVGYNRDGNVYHSYFTGNVDGEIVTGGIVGSNLEGTVKRSYAAGSVDGNEFVGGLVGGNEGTLKDSYATSEVSGNNVVGGLCGWINAPVENSYATGDVSGDELVGGLSGWVRAPVKNSYAAGDVSGEEVVGGLIGLNEGSVKNSYATGDVSGNKLVGGLIGLNEGSVVENSYAAGDVSGEEVVGGLIGLIRASVENSYATGDVTGEEVVGGLVGRNEESNVSDSFWDVEGTGVETSDGGTGKNTSEMKDVATYTDTGTDGLEEAWDFVGNPYDDEGEEDIWDIDEEEEINDGYPFFARAARELTINIRGEGTVRVDDEEVYDGWNGPFDESDEVVLRADPDHGWYLDRWSGDYEGEEEKITITMDEDKVITAHFEEYVDLTIEDIIGDGTITVDGEKVEETPFEKEYEKGEEINLHADPAEGWYFDRWEGIARERENEEDDDNDDNDDNITIMIDEDVTITPVFEEDHDPDTGLIILMGIIVGVGFLIFFTILAIIGYKLQKGGKKVGPMLEVERKRKKDAQDRSNLPTMRKKKE